jgi:prepilin-type N-terminal cleavage/methylation domain-containing protein
MKFNLKSSKGFTLIEVLVAMVLLSLFGVALLSALGTASKTLQLTDVKETARNLAEMQMESIKHQPWALGYNPVTSDPDIAAQYQGFEVVITADEFPRLPETDLQKITVSIRFTGREVYSVVSFKEKQRIYGSASCPERLAGVKI